LEIPGISKIYLQMWAEEFFISLSV